jgi:predicted esterase
MSSSSFCARWLSALLLIACGDSSTDDGTADWPAPTSGKPHMTFNSVAVDPLTSKPAVNDCVTDVSAGEHKFNCDGITYLVLVHPQCLKKQCGLIFDIHGATMSGLQMRDNTLLNEIAPQAGYIYVNPSKVDRNTGGIWDLNNDADPAKQVLVFDKFIAAYQVNPKRIHVTGFSQGGYTTFYFIAHRNAALASAAPVAGALQQPAWANDSWQPRIPILVMNGNMDTASTIDASNELVDALVTGLELSGGDVIKSDPLYKWKRYTGTNADVEYITHDYGGQAVLAGHCIPGGIDVAGAPNNVGLNATSCTTPVGANYLPWGDTVLQWFIDHPKS